VAGGKSQTFGKFAGNALIFKRVFLFDRFSLYRRALFHPPDSFIEFVKVSFSGGVGGKIRRIIRAESANPNKHFKTAAANVKVHK
jgi:hypothetical protein